MRSSAWEAKESLHMLDLARGSENIVLSNGAWRIGDWDAGANRSERQETVREEGMGRECVLKYLRRDYYPGIGLVCVREMSTV